MTGMNIDPNNWLVYRLNSQLRDPLLSTAQLSVPQIKLYPNPATDFWRAENVPANSLISVTDLAGRVLWNSNSLSNPTVIVPGQKLVPGVYLLRIVNSDKTETTYKLVKE